MKTTVMMPVELEIEPAEWKQHAGHYEAAIRITVPGSESIDDTYETFAADCAMDANRDAEARLAEIVKQYEVKKDGPI